MYLYMFLWLWDPQNIEKAARQGGFRNVFRIAGARSCGAIRGIIPAISQGSKGHGNMYKHIGGHTHVISSVDA